MPKRTMTLVVIVEDSAEMKPIYDAHMSGNLIHGFQVVTIANGNLLERLTTIEESTDRILELYQENRL